LCYFQDWDNIIDARFETLEGMKLGPEVGRNIPFVGFVLCPRLRSLKLTCHLDGWISLAGCSNLESLEVSMPDAEEPTAIADIPPRSLTQISSLKISGNFLVNISVEFTLPITMF
jgi:hypothetical protein